MRGVRTMVSTEQSTSTLRYVVMAHYLAGIQSELWPRKSLPVAFAFLQQFLYAMEQFGKNIVPTL